MDKLAVIIPAYNEEQTIQKVVKDVLDVTNEISESNVYVYDNNSNDNTAELARAAGAIVRSEYAQGKGAVIRRMFREIDASAYIMIDADDTYPVEMIPEMYRRVIEQNVDMVVGDRLSSTYFEENKRPFHNLGNGLVRGLINRLFKTNIRDILTGYRAFSYQFVKTFPILSKGFEIETEMSIHAAEKNMLVDNLVIEYRDRPDGSESKLNTYGDGLRVIKTVISLYREYHPFSFYSFFSILSGLVATILFCWRVLFPYNDTHTVVNFPSLVVSMLFYFVSILTFFVGSILSSIQSIEKRNFEMSLVQTEMKKNRTK
ncbi:glycosyltransferase family 2 protein [Fructobacillus ficulneus]|uniref:Glycosyltransferase n=1 Tax=Fructobacillus ficulneus TaxID=157463 RepID=A0A0K8MF05_9LACO|nr:glycosyltransferase family 2 protein [Fructobacillus ficulneus]GAO99116.1 glycosyltransferase [Fructobacillus ficulneus]